MLLGLYPRHISGHRSPGVRVEEHVVQEAHAGDAIGHRVMNPGGDRLSAVIEWTDDIEGPQRPLVVEMLGHQGADCTPQIVPRGARVGIRPDVVTDVEGGRLDPPRPVTGGVDALTRTRLCFQSAGHPAAQRLDVDRRHTGFEDHQLQGVPHNGVGLQAEDARIVGRELIRIIGRQGCLPQSESRRGLSPREL